MERRARTWIVGGGVAALVAVVAAVFTLQRRTASVVDVVPRNAGLVVEVDLAALRASPRGRDALEGLLAKLPGSAACARDVLASVERVGLAVPVGSGYADELAIVAVGAKLRAKETLACADAVVRARGGEPRAGTLGSFGTMQEGAGERGVLAVRDGGPLVLGRGVWLAAVLDVAEGVTRSLRDDPVHDVGRRAQKSAVATLTYALPEEVRSSLGAALPPSAQPLLRVPSAIAALRFDEGGTTLGLELEALCDPATCTALVPLAENARTILAADPRVTLLGLRDEVKGATVAAAGDRLRVSLRVPLARIDAIVAQVSSASPPLPALPSNHPDTDAAGPLGSASPTLDAAVDAAGDAAVDAAGDGAVDAAP